MGHATVRRLLTTLLPGLFVTLAGPAVALGQPAGNADDHCNPGANPAFTFGFADLKRQLGHAMGSPVTCEFLDPDGAGDIQQQTTTGTAFWRKSTNTPTFTDGFNHWALTNGSLVTWTGSTIDPPATVDPAFARFSVFGGAVLVPAQGAPAFAGFEVFELAAQANSYGVAWRQGDLVPAASLGGLIIDLPYEGPPANTCQPAALYCTEDALGLEVFRGLTVRGEPATVRHQTCCSGSFWSIEWRDSTAHTNYSLEFRGEAPFGSLDVPRSPDNRRGAERLVAVAEALVLLPGRE